MHRYRIRIALSLSAVCFVACLSAFGASGDETQTKGMIISRTGETLIVSGPNGHVTVVLTEDTKTKDDRGLFGLATEEMAATALIPGLKVRVDGVADSQGRLVAKTITVDGDDLETAEMIQSGVHPTAEQVAANLRTLEAHRGQLAGHRAGQRARNLVDDHGRVPIAMQRGRSSVHGAPSIPPRLRTSVKPTSASIAASWSGR